MNLNDWTVTAAEETPATARDQARAMAERGLVPRALAKALAVQAPRVRAMVAKPEKPAGLP